MLRSICVLALCASAISQVQGQPYFPAFFDDFDYCWAPLDDDSSRPECGGASGDNLFGTNSWYVGGGKSTDGQAWHRVAWGGKEINPASNDIWFIGRGHDYAKMYIDMKANRIDSDGQDPVVVSNFATPHRGAGTYAARIWFDDIDGIEGQMQQAFWARSPLSFAFRSGEAYGEWFSISGGSTTDSSEVRAAFTELDFEFGNWVEDKGRMHIGNWRDNAGTKLPGSECANDHGNTCSAMSCVYPQDPSLNADECRTQDDESAISKKWWYLVFVVDPVAREVRYSMQSDGWVPGQFGAMWAGEPVSVVVREPWAVGGLTATDYPHYGGATNHFGNFPTFDLAIVLSQHYQDSTQTLGRDVRMGVDWVYYSPVPNLDVADIKREVIEWRDDGQLRVNTANVRFQTRNTQSPLPEPSILGEEVVTSAGSYEYELESVPLGTRLEAMYRHRSFTGGRLPSWTYHADKTFSLDLDPQAPRCIEIEAGVNKWHFPSDTDIRTRKCVEVGDASSYCPSSCNTLIDASELRSPTDTGEEGIRARSTSALPASVGLTAYPNPMRDQSTIRLAVLEAGPVEVLIYDALGRAVANVLERELQAGFHEIEFDATKLSPGVYIYRMRSGNEIISGRFTVLSSR